jgi:hypothetical protein
MSDLTKAQLLGATAFTVVFLACFWFGYFVVLWHKRGDFNWHWLPVIILSIFIGAFAALRSVWGKLP